MKYLGILLAFLTLLKFSRAFYETDTWRRNSTKHVSCRFSVQTFGSCDPRFDFKQTVEIPGGHCPRQWTNKWDDIKLGTDHKLDLQYWFKWPGHMTNIKIESDLKWPLNKDFFDKTKAAVQQALDYVRMEFRDPFGGPDLTVSAKLKNFINYK